MSEDSNDGVVESQVIQDTEEVEERPEPAEIRSPSEDGCGRLDDDGVGDYEVHFDDQEQPQQEEVIQEREEDVPINSQPFEEEEEVGNGVNDDSDEDLVSRSINPKRLLDSDDEDDDLSSPVKTKRLLDSDEEDGEGEAKSSSPRKRIIIPDDDSDDDDELRKLEARVQDSDDEGEKVKGADSDDEPGTQTTIERDTEDVGSAPATAEG